ncbi:MAG: lytic transglycosylase domain-containing protein [Clostridia bacterium]|nr:lytic transglycosylase domain-containing protein [Clostridia bacterium]MBQ8399739.1 lytic transglycosylase domain-containing protein [Clostridia bacterium]
MRKARKNTFSRGLLLMALLVLAASFGYLVVLQLESEDAVKSSGGVSTEYVERLPAMPYFEEVSAASEKYGISRARIYAVIQTESSFRPEVVSSAGAIGLMQMLPATYEEQCLQKGEEYDPEKLKNPAVNIDACTAYLQYLYNLTGDWDAAHVAYHAGIGNVRKWLANKDYSPDGVHLEVIPIEKSRIYLERIKSACWAYERALGAMDVETS